MYTTRAVLLYTVFFHVFSTAKCYQYDCSRSEYNRCVRIADPLVKEAHLVFPDNMADIESVCLTWNTFVECLKSYTDKCFSAEQRRQFNKAVENPIQSVHKMCMQPDYQKEYLQYAPCIKSTITDRNHCGHQYNLLVDQVEQGDYISRETLCCSHDRFKQCITKETRRMCDRGVPNGPASRFSTQILDKALSFLQEQCYNYIPNSGDCILPTNDGRFTDPLMISTSSDEVYPWSTIQESAPKEIPATRVVPPKSTTSWLPSTSIALDTKSTDTSSSDVLGSRTRPASYGRSSSWSDSLNQNTQPGMNTVQLYSETPPTAASRNDWATMSTWHVLNQVPGSPGSPPSGSPGIRNPSETNIHRNNDFPPSYNGGFNVNSSPTPEESVTVSSSTMWYPAAGDQIGNEVEEPNQQGLSYSKNGADVKRKQVLSMTVIATILAFC